MTSRIFHIQPGTGGGTERFFVTLATAFAEEGIQQEFAIRTKRQWRHEIEGIGTLHEGQFLRRTPKGFYDLWRLHHQLRIFKPDAVIAWRAPAARLIPRDINAAKVVRLGDYPRHVRHFSGLDAVVCNNPSIMAHIRNLGWSGNAPIISNFARSTSNSKIERKDLLTPNDAFVVCGAGRFTKIKGFDVLIDAVAQLDSVYLWLVGDGPEAEALRWQAEDLGISERVKFSGWLEDPTKVINSADAFVLPSRNEPLGNALIEAWRVGIPTVSTRTDGPNWYAKDFHDTLLVPINDPTAIANALQLLQENLNLCSHLVAGANKTLSELFDRNTVIRSYLSLIDKINKNNLEKI